MFRLTLGHHPLSAGLYFGLCPGLQWAGELVQSLLLLVLLAAPAAQASEPLLALSSDRATYAVGATAHLEAAALVAPRDNTDDFYIGTTLNGAALPLNQVPVGRGIATATLSASGAYTWTVQLYLEKARFAASLRCAVEKLTLQNDLITTQLSQTSDAAQIAQLQAQQAENTRQINEANAELTAIRRPIGPSQSITFTAN